MNNRSVSPVSGAFRRLLWVSLPTLISAACYSAAPLTIQPGPSPFGGTDVVRVTLLDGTERKLWYPVMSGDSVWVGLPRQRLDSATIRIHVLDIAKVSPSVQTRGARRG